MQLSVETLSRSAKEQMSGNPNQSSPAKRSDAGRHFPTHALPRTKEVSVRTRFRRYPREMTNLIVRHRDKIVKILSCFDRLMLQGALPSVASPQAGARSRGHILKFNFLLHDLPSAVLP